MMNVVSLQEQVRFFYGWDPKDQQQHIFDVVVTLDCESRIAIAVKPEIRLVSGRFVSEMQEVAWWVYERGFADDVLSLILTGQRQDLRTASGGINAAHSLRV